MKFPVQAVPVARQPSRRQTTGSVTPSGCCAQVCLPIVGCHCVAESPFC